MCSSIARTCIIYYDDITMPTHNIQEKTADAIKAARMYYYQNMTTGAIAKEMKVSRSSVSRMLSYARAEGLIEIRIIDAGKGTHHLETAILQAYDIERVHVVPVSDIAGEAEWLQRVAQYTASYLNTIFESEMILGIAWGTTLTNVSKHLLRKNTTNAQIVQLNGAGNTRSMGIEYASEIIMKFAKTYRARAHLFPVPTFFDYPDTKKALWKEGSIQRILNLQESADLLLYSIGAVNAGIPSHVYSDGYLEKNDYMEIEKENIVGDIATVFFREDGSWEDIPLNERASGPKLDLFQRKYGICVVSGLGKVRGLHAALKGKLMKEVILDEPSARELISRYSISK